MIKHSIKVRVRYAETDQMGYVYYGNYATYFEVARVETFRSLGFSYREMEEDGILMPVLELQTKYIKPIFYDEEISIQVIIKEKPGLRIKFEYEVYNSNNELTTIGFTSLVFVDKATGKPCIPQGKFGELLTHSFS